MIDSKSDMMQVEVAETIGLMPHPSDPSHPPIEPYISDVLPDLLAKYDWLGLILAVFDSDSGLGEHPKPPTIHALFDESTGYVHLPMSEEPIKSHSDAERWLERFWLHPRQDFNVNRLAPQLVLKVDGRHYFVVTVELDRVEFGHLKNAEHWTADLGGLSEDSRDYHIIAAVARDYANTAS